MNKKIILIITAVIIVGGSVYFYLTQTNNNDIYIHDAVFYKKESSWGPCPNPEGGCFLNTYVYASGKVVLESKTTEEKQLSKDVVNNIIKEIRDSGIMDKDCDAPLVLDLWITYTIDLDDRVKKIRFPGCEDEMGKIDQLIRIATGRTDI